MKILIETLGCPKNFNDSEYAAGILEQAGHRVIVDTDSTEREDSTIYADFINETDPIREADVIIINTCGFINDAKVESIDTIFAYADAKRDDAILIVSGCLSQRYIDELYEEMPEVDIFIGVNDYDRLPEILDDYCINYDYGQNYGKTGNSRRFKIVSEPGSEFTELKCRKIPENPYSATIKIAEGCSNACAYCIIPQIRGPQRSRKQENIIKEAGILATEGCRELILIAQDVAAYGEDLYGKPVLAELLRELCRIEGIKWIRLLYCYEEKITDELIDVISSEEKICKYIDIPLQHCSDHVLSDMNRASTGSSIRNTIAKLRAKVPGIHIRTTLMTGFPGETEEDFQELYDFVQETKFERLGVFAFSSEEGTVAAKMPDQIPEDVGAERRDSIMRAQVDISLESNLKKRGALMDVIVDGAEDAGGLEDACCKEDTECTDGFCATYIGRTEFDAPEIDNEVIFESNRPLKKGEIVKVRIVDAFDYDLTGRLEE